MEFSTQSPIGLPPSTLELPLERLRPPLCWVSIFGREGACAIEIGTGNGIFLASEAARLPKTNFLGIERAGTFYDKMVNRCARAGLRNVRATQADAIELLEKWIPERSLTRVYCYFSDPWPKRRHGHRRVFTRLLPPLLRRALAPAGELWFKTDVGYYFNLTVTLFREQDDWTFLTVGKIPPPDPAKGEVMTNFERKARETGGQVWGFKVRVD